MIFRNIIKQSETLFSFRISMVSNNLAGTQLWNNVESTFWINVDWTLFQRCFPAGKDVQIFSIGVVYGIQIKCIGPLYKSTVTGHNNIVLGFQIVEYITLNDGYTFSRDDYYTVCLPSERGLPLQKHAYSNMEKISPPKTELFPIKTLIFFMFLLKT